MELPIDLILKLLGMFGTALAAFIGYNAIKNKGREEFSRETMELQLHNLIQNKKKTEEIRAKNHSYKSVIPNDWDDVTELCPKRDCSLDEIADAVVHKKD